MGHGGVCGSAIETEVVIGVSERGRRGEGWDILCVVGIYGILLAGGGREGLVHFDVCLFGVELIVRELEVIVRPSEG